jgi:hypothetical protein
MPKFNSKSIITFALVIFLVMCVCNMGSAKPDRRRVTSYMSGSPAPSAQPQSVSGIDMDDLDDEYAPANHSGADIDLNIGCAMNAGVGLASSLLPREMASQEDFGQFAPDDILKGQNFLDPRNQIGFPETIGGNLRNANQQIRADPPNPKQPYTWNNSTIVPDLMQRKICT